MTVGDVLAALEEIAPARLAVSDDPIGLHIGRKSDRVDRVVVALDATKSSLNFARASGAQMVIAHHPLIFHPVKSLAGDSAQVQAIRAAIGADIAVASAHTNWDAASGGVNDTLAAVLQLADVQPFGGDIAQEQLKLITFAPEDSVEAILDAISTAGGGNIGLYRRCAFTSPGVGTYEPLAGSAPTKGAVGTRETVDEVRIEMVVPSDRAQAAVTRLKEVHPYDEPAFDLTPLRSESASLPRKGTLAREHRFDEFAKVVQDALQTATRAFGRMDKRIRSVAVIGGAGGGYWLKAKTAGCDALVTGEVPHHEAVAASESGFCVIEAGHYATEQPGVVALSMRLREYVDTIAYEPTDGDCGRPL